MHSRHNVSSLVQTKLLP